MDPQTKPTQTRVLPLANIRPSPYQARRTFTDETLQALASSMKHEGLIQPITVRRVLRMQDPELRKSLLDERDSEFSAASAESYELVAGERRWRAAKLLGWETIESRVITVISEGEAAAKGLVENLQREDLNPIEEAEGFARLNRVDPVFWTQDKMAEVAGKNRTYISRSLTLLNLPEVIQADMRRGLLTRNHGIELCRLPKAEMQIQMARVIGGKMSVQETRRRINNLLSPSTLLVKEYHSPLSPPDPVGPLWPSFLLNPWLGEIGATDVRYLGNHRWGFEIKLPLTPADATQPLSADARVEIARTLGERLYRLGRSLRVVSRRSFEIDHSSKP